MTTSHHPPAAGSQMILTPASDLDELISARFLAPFVSGELSRARLVRLQRVRPRATLLPPGSRPVCVGVEPYRRITLARGDGWVLRVRRFANRTAELCVLARTLPLADRVLAAATRDAVEPLVEDVRRVPVGFWHLAGHGPVRVERALSVEPWHEIRRNYTAPAAEALDRVMTVDPGAACGRLLLLHGPPGTGKTTVLRALAAAWRRWCQVDYVLDPELLLGHAGYLVGAALGVAERGSHPSRPTRRWRMLVLEDCDELIAVGAKRETGQALARLLNLTDGMLGQGTRLLVAITTNEPLTRLHPAVVRPGRCLAQVEVGRLTAAECRRWLGGPGPDGATLAELWATRGSAPIEHTAGPVRAGLYL